MDIFLLDIFYLTMVIIGSIGLCTFGVWSVLDHSVSGSIVRGLFPCVSLPQCWGMVWWRIGIIGSFHPAWTGLGILSGKKICVSLTRLIVTPTPWDSGPKKPYTSLGYSTHSWSTSMEAFSCTMSMLQATQWMTVQIISSTNPDLQYCVSHESSWISSPDFELVGRIRVQTMYSYFTRLVITTLSRLSMLIHATRSEDGHLQANTLITTGTKRIQSLKSIETNVTT